MSVGFVASVVSEELVVFAVFAVSVGFVVFGLFLQLIFLFSCLQSIINH